MSTEAQTPFFTIIIPTRNRPVLFRKALESVLGQNFGNREVIVVIDGSSAPLLAEYDAVEAHYPDVTFHRLAHRVNGHGQSYSMNCGAAMARGRYLCFLDDDDYWIDDDYLEDTYQNITSSNDVVDMHYSNQMAFFADGSRQTRNVWLEDLIPRIGSLPHNRANSFFADAGFLISSGGFAHLNCSVFRREFFHQIEGMDESIRYENDRDVYIRAVDAAATILYSTRFVSRHHIPDVSKRENMSTVSSGIEKKMYQLRVYDKGIANSRHAEVVAACRKGKTWELKHLTAILARQGRFASAAHYAREALINGFNLRWLAYCLYLGGRGFWQGNRRV